MVIAAVCSLLQRLDIFGHRIGVHYRGEDTYKTIFGGLLTLATYILVSLHTFNLVSSFLDYSAQTEKFSQIKQSLFNKG